MDKKIVDVKFSHGDSGNCREYYRTVVGNQLICRQEETSGNFVWYTAIDDGTWEEPCNPINMDKCSIEIVEVEA